MHLCRPLPDTAVTSARFGFASEVETSLPCSIPPPQDFGEIGGPAPWTCCPSDYWHDNRNLGPYAVGPMAGGHDILSGTTQVPITDAPTVPGLGFRRLRDSDDHAGIAAVRTGSVDHDRIDVQSPREGLPTAADLAGIFSLAEMRDHPDLLIVTINDRIIGYAHVLWRWTEVTGERVYLHLGYLLPEWRGKGIGSSMLHWSQTRIRAITAVDRHDGPQTFATNVSSTESEAANPVKEEGYAIVWQLADMILELGASVPRYPLPAGIECRPLIHDHFRPIYHAWKDAFAHIWTSTPPSDEDLQAFVRDNFAHADFDPTLCDIAWVKDEVVGLVLCRITNGIGMIAEVAVRPHWQRQGIARALLARSLGTLQRRNVAQARLFTDAEDHQGARSVYQQFGFRESKRHAFYRKPL